MKQVLVKKGEITVEELPIPAIADNEVLIKTHYSLISTGTELSGISMSKESLVTRAIKQPHNLKKAMKMAGDRGFMQTYKIIKGMLDFGTPTGYSLAGEVVEVGKNVTDLRPGNFVAASGANIANHAQYAAVPRLLVSRIPDGLDLKQAASVTLGAIAMQGVRQAEVTFGETVAVIGLGLLGQLTCQILAAAGCRVIGIDIDSARMEIAKNLGANWTVSPQNIFEVKKITEGFGVDAAIITASTEKSDPINQAMEITRKKGRVIVVGAIGLELKRNPWYEKEIDLKISCSYGPGRYDPTYETEMLDYPFPYVRWTENRNMEEYLKLLAEKKVDFLALSPAEYPIENAPTAYEELKEKKPLAVLLRYDAKPAPAENKIFVHAKKSEKDRIKVALIGAGAFAMITHLPNLEKLKNVFSLHVVCAKTGIDAKKAAKKYGASYCATDYREVLKDPEVDAVLITTRHDLHAKMALEALKAGKDVFVEKPLAVTKEELEEIKDFFRKNSQIQDGDSSSATPLLTVGFNRRFSPFALRIKELTQNRRNPLIMNYRVNAGYLPADHWTQQTSQGGRIIGEACHFFDLFNFWTNSKPKEISAASIKPHAKDVFSQDNFSATISYEDGSVCTLLYTALGPRDLPKEYAEIFCDGKALVLDDFRRLKVSGGGGSQKTFSQDKGHFAELKQFAEGIKKGEFPIPLEEIFTATEISFEVNQKIVGDE